MTDEKKTEEKKTEEFDIVWLLHYVKAKRIFVAKITGIALAVAMIMFAVKPKEFEAEASILPLSKQSSGLKGLGALAASITGIDISSMGGGTTVNIGPTLFSDIINSTPVMLNIMNTPVTWTDPDTIESLYSHTKRDTIMSAGDYLMAYTIRLPWTIKDALMGKPEPIVARFTQPDGSDQSMDFSPMTLDKTQDDCIKDLGKRILVDIDDEVDLVRVTCTASNPIQCAELTRIVLEQIQEAVTEFSTKNARLNIKYLEEQIAKTNKEYSEARQKYMEYKDRNRGVIEERTGIESQMLEDEYQMSYNLLQTLQAQLETSRLDLVSQTPVFSVVEPVVIPQKKSSPKFLHHAIGGVIVGMVIAIGWLLLSLGYKQVFAPEAYKEIYDKYK